MLARFRLQHHPPRPSQDDANANHRDNGPATTPHHSTAARSTAATKAGQTVRCDFGRTSVNGGGHAQRRDRRQR